MFAQKHGDLLLVYIATRDAKNQVIKFRICGLQSEVVHFEKCGSCCGLHACCHQT